MSDVNHNEPEIMISKDEYHELLSKAEYRSFDWQGWIKVSLSIILPGVAIITYINTIDAKVEQVQKDIARHERWIELQDSKNADISAAINRVASNQSVVLEKIDRAQQDIRRLIEQGE